MGHGLGQSFNAGIEYLEGEGACLWDFLPTTISAGIALQGQGETTGLQWSFQWAPEAPDFFHLFSLPDASSSSSPEMSDLVEVAGEPNWPPAEGPSCRQTDGAKD